MTEVYGVIAENLLPGDLVQLELGPDLRVARTVPTSHNRTVVHFQDHSHLMAENTHLFRVENNLNPLFLASHAWAFSGADGISWDRSTTFQREVLTKELEVERMEVQYIAPSYGEDPAWILTVYTSDETRQEWTVNHSEPAPSEREALEMIFGWIS